MVRRISIVCMKAVPLALRFVALFGLQAWTAWWSTLLIYPDTNKESRSKSDPVDARKLALHLATGLLQAINIASEKLQKQRSLIRFRKKLWGDLVRSKNRLKGELLFQGMVIPKQYDNAHWSHNFLDWIEQQAGKEQDLRDTLLLMLEEVKLLRVLLLKTQAETAGVDVESRF
jgi:transposase